MHESEHRAAPASFKMELISALRPSRRVAEAGLREVLGVIGPRTQSENVSQLMSLTLLLLLDFLENLKTDRDFDDRRIFDDASAQRAANPGPGA